MSLMRTYRRALGLSQSAFAARLNVPLETYRPWDAGRREPRRGRNPKTGDRVDVPSKRVPYFKPGKELKELINRDPCADGMV